MNWTPILSKILPAAFMAVAFALTAKADEPKTRPLPFRMPEIAEPTFPDRICDIGDYGAVPGGEKLNTDAFAQAIEACAGAGGGVVRVPPGVWLTGAVHLKSGVNLRVEKGATVRFSDNPKHYLPEVFTRWEGVECYNYSPLIYCRGCENVAITGEGTLDGNGKSWWNWKGMQTLAVKRLYEDGRLNAPVEERRYASMQNALRPAMIQFIESKNILLEDYTAIDSPFWTNHIVYSENVIARNLKIVNPPESPNTDGFNVDSSRNVRIVNLFADVGDDAICAKSGRDQDGRRVGRPTENMLVDGCEVNRAHGGFVVGSEMSGGVRNVAVRDCVYRGADNGIRLKATPQRGGVVENIFVDNVAMENIRDDAIWINLLYGGAAADEPTETPPEYRNISIKNIMVNGAQNAVTVVGLEDKPVDGLFLVNLQAKAEKGASLSFVSNVMLNHVDIEPREGPAFSIENGANVIIRSPGIADGLKSLLYLSGDESSYIVVQSDDPDFHEGMIDQAEDVPEGTLLVPPQ